MIINDGEILIVGDLHFSDVFTSGFADAALAASVFHYHEIDIIELKRYLQKQGIAVRL